MNRYFESAILLCICVIFTFGCSTTKRSGFASRNDEQSGGSDELTSSAESKRSSGQRGLVAAKNGRLRDFTFVVPDNWEVLSPEHNPDVGDMWEILPIPGGYGLYMAYHGDPKARFCFQVFQGTKNDEGPMTLERFQTNRSRTEKALTDKLKTDTVNLIESSNIKLNGLDGFRLHYSYCDVSFSSSARKGDILLEVLHRDGSMLFLTGTFPSPLYSELQGDIKKVMESIRKE